jgi:hypothetical protein
MSTPTSKKSKSKVAKGARNRSANVGASASTSVVTASGRYVTVTWHGEPAVENVVPVGALDFAPIFVTP